jgi:O-antigen ligase
MKKSELTNVVRIPSAILLIALEFTNIVAFWAEGGNEPASIQHSRYPFQFAAYGLAAVVLLLDRRGLRRFFNKPIVHWSLCALLLFSLSMLVRAFNAPVGYSYYDFVRYFGLQVNAIGFLLTCVIIFDDPMVLPLTRQAIVIATLAGVAFNAYDLLSPGVFSTISGRAAGLYVQPNGAGMALVFGGLLGVTTIRRLWMREAFLLCVLVGILATFSRQAMLSVVILVVGSALAGVLSFRRLAIAGTASLALFAVLNLSSDITDSRLLNADTWSRLTLQWSDTSVRSRLQLAEKTLGQFEEAPLIGQGFGTALFWADEESHNAYLGLLADCGILGALVIPCLILSIRRADWEFYTFAAIFLLWAFFYHGVLADFFGIIALAVEADECCEGYRPLKEGRYKVRIAEPRLTPVSVRAANT